jgi:hypothetical protein
MLRIATVGFGFSSRRYRWLGYGLCFVGAVVVALALFAMMKALIRMPRTVPSLQTFSVFLRGVTLPGPAPEPHKFFSRKAVPPVAPYPFRNSSVSAPMVKIVRSVLAPVLPNVNTRVSFFMPRMQARPLTGINWMRAFRRYLKQRNSTPAPFSMPKLPQRRLSLLDGPERIHLSDGADLERIGKHCYLVPADNYQTNAAIDPQFARLMQTMRPLFAHAVFCDPDARKTLGEEFLEALRKRGYGSP